MIHACSDSGRLMGIFIRIIGHDLNLSRILTGMQMRAIGIGSTGRSPNQSIQKRKSFEVDSESSGSNFSGIESAQDVVQDRNISIVSRASDIHFKNFIEHNLNAPAENSAQNYDDIWMNSLVKQYQEISQKGIQGDVPPPAAFARDRDFWVNMLACAITGAILGILSLIFLNLVDTVPKVWTQLGAPITSSGEDYFSCGICTVAINDDENAAIALKNAAQSDSCHCDKYTNMNFYAGNRQWIIITTASGAFVGLIRYLIRYPDDMPGLFKEIHTYHVDPIWAPWTFLLSLISIAGGASLGPEQALGNLGGGLATFLTDRKFVRFNDDDHRKLFVLGGMTGALGALFPTPMLGVLMLHELGNPPKSYMESTLILSCSACVAFLMYYGILETKSYITLFSNNGAVLSYQWKFNEWNCGTAIVIGMVSACLGIVVLLFIGICKQIFNRIRMRLYLRNTFLAHFLPSVIAGVLIGTVNWALPITVGNGNMVVEPLLQYVFQGQLSTKLLICSGFAKMFVLGVSMNGGFIGGFVFPMISMGIIAGCVAYKMYPTILPLGLCISCFMAALPASICPMPFTLTGLAIFCFYFGLYQTAPIFISVITSYTIVCGTGLFGAMQARGMQQTEAQKKQLQEALDLKLQQKRSTMASTAAQPEAEFKKSMMTVRSTLHDPKDFDRDAEEAADLSKSFAAQRMSKSMSNYTDQLRDLESFTGMNIDFGLENVRGTNDIRSSASFSV